MLLIIDGGEHTAWSAGPDFRPCWRPLTAADTRSPKPKDHTTAGSCQFHGMFGGIGPLRE